jgi:hypothetical protein
VGIRWYYARPHTSASEKGIWAKGEPVLDPGPTHGPESQRICIAFEGLESLGDLAIPQNSRPAPAKSLA